MHSDSDLMSVYDFLRGTPEGSLKKMMVSGKMTDGHFMLMMKIARGCTGQEFAQHANAGTLPKIKLGPKEVPLKETIWPIALGKFEELGLIAAQAKAA